MSTVPPVNIQQVLQMGTHAEKLQQTLQHLPHTSGHHLDEERKIADELKRKTVQNAKSGQATNATDPEGKGRRHQKQSNAQAQAPEEETPEKPFRTRGNQGETIDVVI